MNDPIANALSKILNMEKVGKHVCLIRPSSKVLNKILEIMKNNLYIGDFTIIKDSKGDVIRLKLIGRINKCGAIKPKYSVKKDEYEKFEKRYLLAKDFGLMIVSTPKGIMIHTEAKKKNLGGRLLAYCY